MSSPIRLGTRSSPLARAQAEEVRRALAPLLPGRSIEIVPISTRGDSLAGPLAEAGGKGLFTAELESALRQGRLDLAVHSAKDLPAEMADDLLLAAALPRADVRDALLSRAGPPDPLPRGATIGTSSLRRAALLRAIRPDFQILPLRGNLETRIQKVLGPGAEFDATVLAMAGLRRGGWQEKLAKNLHPLPEDFFPPAAGQGILALQTPAPAKGAKEELLAVLRALNHAETFQALQAERAVLRHLGADCHSCLAVHVFAEEGLWRARAMIARPDGSDMLRAEATGPTACLAAEALTDRLQAQGATQRLRGTWK